MVGSSFQARLDQFVLVWNSRGLGNPTLVQILVDLIYTRKPDVVFIKRLGFLLADYSPLKLSWVLKACSRLIVEGKVMG